MLSAASPAAARPLFHPPKDFSLETLLSDPVGLAAGAILLIAFIAGAWFVLRRSPTTAELERRRETFLSKLPSDSKGYKAVLYQDEVFGMAMADRIPPNHRIRVELVHENPEKSKTLYRSEDIEAVRRGMYRDKSQEASNLWLDTAAKRDLPAVCATRKGIQKLEARHFAELEQDRERFLKKLHSRMWVGSRRPAG